MSHEHVWYLEDGPSAGFFEGALPDGYVPLAEESGLPKSARWITAAELNAYLVDARRLVDIAGQYAIGFIPWVRAFEVDQSREPGHGFFKFIDGERKYGQLS